MALDLAPVAAAEQGQLERARVGDVGRDIERRVARPPETHRRAVGVAILHIKRDRDAEREKHLQAAAHENHKRARRAHHHRDGVPRLVENQVDVMHPAPRPTQVLHRDGEVTRRPHGEPEHEQRARDQIPPSARRVGGEKHEEEAMHARGDEAGGADGGADQMIPTTENVGLQEPNF